MKIRFKGLRPIGTLHPRRLWRPGEIVEVDDDIGKELLKIPGFEKVKLKRVRRRSLKREA